jgi:GNAT superfamily N-acetyltransferase
MSKKAGRAGGAARIRKARAADAAEIARLIKALADYAKLPHQCKATAAAVRRTLFAEKPLGEAFVAEAGGRIAGVAIFFTSYSTFLCKGGLYLEDLFVEPEHRGSGMGKALLERVIAEAKRRGYARIEWHVLDWNKPSIDFYVKAFGAELMKEWVRCRVTVAGGGKRNVRAAGEDRPGG